MTNHHVFPAFSRVLHWAMAAMILAMLFIGIGMVTSPGDYHRLVRIHRPLGICILALVAVRLLYRVFNPPPPLPNDMPAWMRAAARSSHFALYGLMFAQPLVGWAMLSAGAYPIVLYGPIHLPPIMPHIAPLYAVLRQAHTVLALLLFATFLAHLSAALTHALIFRDRVFESMAAVTLRRRGADHDGRESAETLRVDGRGGGEAESPA
ncbi:MAG TPA: cytochrome b [Caulobacteraceae bacterium]|jgi:cytochrome b561